MTQDMKLTTPTQTKHNINGQMFIISGSNAHHTKKHIKTSKQKLTVLVRIVDHHGHNQHTVPEIVGCHSNQTERIHHFGRSLTFCSLYVAL